MTGQITSIGSEFSPMPAPGIVTFADLLAMEVKPPSFVIEGLIVEGQVGFLAGPFAIGKTMLTLQLVQSLASGRPFMGRPVRRAYKTAFLDLENGTEEIARRLQSQVRNAEPGVYSVMPEDFQKCLYVNTKEAGPLKALKLDKDGFEKLRIFVQANAVEALVIDNFGRVFPGKESEEEAMKKFFDEIDALRSRCPSLQRGMILFLHHVTKPSNQGPAPDLLTEPYNYLGRVRGSGRLHDFSEFRLAFDRQEEKDDGERYYVINGVVRSSEVTPFILEFNEGDLSFRVHSNLDLRVQKAFGKAKKQKELFLLLPDHFRFTDGTRMKGNNAKGFHKETVRDMLKAAKANALVRQETDGSYRKIGRIPLPRAADIEPDSSRPDRPTESLQ